MPDPIIKFQSLVKTYNNTTILDKISLDINSGEIFGVIGASGSGKTTLLTTLIGYIPIDSGDILFSQKILVNKSLKENFKSIFARQKTIKSYSALQASHPHSIPNLLFMKILIILETFTAFQEMSER
jgi:ABC-type multidrug transport system ATPase subunit